MYVRRANPRTLRGFRCLLSCSFRVAGLVVRWVPITNGCCGGAGAGADGGVMVLCMRAAAEVHIQTCGLYVFLRFGAFICVLRRLRR